MQNQARILKTHLLKQYRRSGRENGEGHINGHAKKAPNNGTGDESKTFFMIVASPDSEPDDFAQGSKEEELYKAHEQAVLQVELIVSIKHLWENKKGSKEAEEPQKKKQILTQIQSLSFSNSIPLEATKKRNHFVPRINSKIVFSSIS